MAESTREQRTCVQAARYLRRSGHNTRGLSAPTTMLCCASPSEPGNGVGKARDFTAAWLPGAA
jgi:hypothetical protein